MNCLARLLIQFVKMRQAEAADIKLAERRLADREASNSKMVNSVSSAVQKARPFQIGQEAVHGADRQTGQPRDLLGGQPARRFTEQLEKTEPSL